MTTNRRQNARNALTGFLPVGVVVLALASPVALAGGPSIRFVPVTGPVPYPPGTVIDDANGSIAIPSPNNTLVYLEARVDGWASTGHAVKSYQWTADSAGYASGSGAPLTNAVRLCANNAACAPVFGAGIVTSFTYCNSGQCENAIQFYRPDLVFDPGVANSGCSVTGARACGQSALCCHVDDPPGEMYAGTLILDVPPDAAGTYAVGFLAGGMFFVLDDNTEVALELIPATIVIPDCCDAVSVGDDVCALGPNHGSPCSQHSDCPSGRCGTKNRYLSFVPGPNIGAIRIEVIDFDMAPAHNGEVWWVGPSGTYSESPSPGSFTGATLQCTQTPHVENWSGAGMLHVTGEVVAPNSTYEVRVCDPLTLAACSSPLRITTARWSDVVAPYGAAQPNFTDISALVAKYQGILGAIPKARAQLQPYSPSPAAPINFVDISFSVNAFRGVPYPFTMQPQLCP